MVMQKCALELNKSDFDNLLLSLSNKAVTKPPGTIKECKNEKRAARLRV